MAVSVRKTMVTATPETYIITKPTAVLELVERTKLPVSLHGYLAVHLNYNVIPMAEWPTTFANQKDIVNITVVPRGGDGDGKKILGMVAMVALTIWTMGAGGAAFLGGYGLSGGYLTAARMGIMFVGSMAINALFAPPVPNMGSLTTGGGDNAGMLGVSGQRNQARVHQPVRSLYGTMKVAPDIAAEPYTAVSGILQTLYSIYDFGYGEIDIENLQIGNTDIDKYKGVKYEVYQNYKDGDVKHYANDNVTAQHQIEINDHATVMAFPDVCDEGVVDISFPMGLTRISHEDGSHNGTFVTFEMFIRKPGQGWVKVKTSQLTTSIPMIVPWFGDPYLYANKTKPFVFTAAIVFPSHGDWELMISRGQPRYPNTATGTDRYADKTVLVSMRAIQYKSPVKFDKQHTIMTMQLTATDQLNGMVDTLSAMCYRKVQDFDGQWVRSSNPALIALDILTGAANPIPVNPDRIDFQAFIDFHAFCVAKNYQVGCNWDGESTVAERLVSVLSSARAAVSIRANKYSVIWEHFPTVPVQLFTPKNSWGFTGVKVFVNIPDALRVSFVNPDIDWQTTDRIVYNDGFDETNAKTYENIDLPLCTDKDRAWKDGRYYLAQGKLRPESFTLTTDVENLICERGDLVGVQHDAGRIGGIPTRVKTISGNDITLVEPVPWQAGTDYRLQVRTKTGDMVEYEIVGQSDQFTVTTATEPTDVSDGDLVVYGEHGYITSEFLVKAIEPGDDLTATMTLVPIARDIENADQGTIPDYNPPIKDTEMVIPENVDAVVDQNIRFVGRMPVVDTVVKWGTKGAGVSYEVWIDDTESGDFNRLTTTGEAEYSLWHARKTTDPDYPSGQTITVKIRAVNVFGYKLPLEEVTPVPFEAAYDQNPPGKPLFFSGNINRDTMQLSWLPPEAPDIGGYVLKYSSNMVDPVWEDSSVLEYSIPHYSTGINVNARVGSYLLACVDTSGNISNERAMVRTTIPDIEGINQIEVMVENPDFTGIYHNTTKTYGGIVLARREGAYAQVGTYQFSQTIDVGDIHRCRISSDISGRNIRDMNMIEWVPALIDIDPLIGTVDPLCNKNFDATVQIRYSSEFQSISKWLTLSSVPFIGQGSESAWSGWQILTAGYYTGRVFQFRAVLTSAGLDTTPLVSGLSVEVDMPDRVEGRNDVMSEIGGNRVLFDGNFKAIPTMGVTADNAAKGERFALSNIGVDGFDIEFFDDVDVSIVRQFDWIANGYGKVLGDVLPATTTAEEDSLELLPGAMLMTRKPYLLT